MIVGCYSLDLYCDVEGCSNSTTAFTGRNRTQATKEARQAGWKVRHATQDQEGRAVCPRCKQEGER